MNRFETQMLEVLKELKTRFAATSVRAEFEAEGTKLEELLRLKEICTRAGLGLTLKIGGCESVRDMLEARVVGVRSLAAPMIESAFALQKFVHAIDNVFPAEELEVVSILANVETRMGIARLDEIVGSPQLGRLDAVVIERVDLCRSLGFGPDDINSPEICTIVARALQRLRGAGVRTVVGGGVSADSLPFFRSLPEGALSRFETRKVTFDAPRALAGDPERGILFALTFELFYLKNKMSFFRNISLADQHRLDTLETRYWSQITKALR
jgi:4-hydroxy-2-oxoheptanedioate aldolase